MNSSPRAFTLIELLIVVAIIAILAAIAVPNFLEAQTRSKITRAKADQRTVATGLESYAVDNNHYPPQYEMGSRIFATDALLSLPRLTSPVAYLSSVEAALDPFQRNVKGKGGPNLPTTGMPAKNPYMIYMNFENIKGDFPSSTTFPGAENFNAWSLVSFGPDKEDNAISWRMYNFACVPTSNSGDFMRATYDATNGTISEGDIARFGGSVPAVAAQVTN